MIYSFDITTGLTAPLGVYVGRDLQLCRGIIHKIEITFPMGCNGLVQASIWQSTHPVWPSNMGEYFALNGVTISFREHFELVEEPYQLRAIIYNTDTSFNHTISIRIGILPVHVLAPWLMSYEERIKSIAGED